MANSYYNYINNGSIITVDTSNLIKDVQNEYISVFGESLNLDPSTPQGRLIEIEANSRKGQLEINAMVANQINLKYATGQGLDALGSLYGRNRRVATSTVTLCYLSGSADTVIPADSQAKTSAGDVFYTPNSITLDNTGNATAYFYSLEQGEIPCEVNTLTEIVTEVVGWDSINNPAGATIGNNQESDNNFRTRIEKSKYSGIGLLGDVESALNSLEDIISYYIYNNGENEAITIEDNVTCNAHSVLVIVQGGDDEEIAEALFKTVSAGCGYTALSGQETVVNIVKNIGTMQSTYPITFNKPLPVEFICKVTVGANNYTGSNLENDIKNAINNWANNQVAGVDGLILGTDVYAFEIGSAISSQIPEIIIKNVEIALIGGELSNSPITININQIGVITNDNITVEID